MSCIDEKIESRCGIFRRIFLPGIFFLSALAVRIAYFSLCDRLHRDAYRYIDFARDLVASNWNWQAVNFTENFDFPPLLTVLNGLMIEAGFSPLIGGGAICIFFGALLPLAIYALCRQLFQERIYAEIAAVFAVFHPGFVNVSASILRDPIYLAIFGFALALGIYVAKNRKSFWWWGVYGILAGVAMLCRKEAVELPVFAVVWLMADVCFDREKSFVKRLLQALGGVLLILSIAALIVAPFVCWTGMRIGMFFAR